MKFVKLHSRGGNYLVVASNVAWLRTAENGQTNVGMVGGQPLLVVGSIEEVAETILNATAEAQVPASPLPDEQVEAPVAPPPLVEVPVPVSQPVAKAPAPEATPPASEPVAIAPEPEPLEQKSEPEPVAVVPEPEPEAEPAPAPPARTVSPAASRPRPVPRNSASLWERPAAPTSSGLKVKAGSQRMMGALD